ncbi:hypothetical protein CLPU_9c00380 [Gottschalkia purinilytica]|uniref:Rad50/SbcC-type AAA domain-containing protein n=1 Tax=Gottschalkia purinilytica TaxID=1503 RepID=A0A0L0W9L9_GOTPU|nr:AAA family ATPase [Gottschalkia purinilytica]KNF08142.1 hypothetical protein CLPU_9c00380 [Gottschalkia purinilytica]
MIIKELMINSFGKFKNKKIELNNGINIIYGENEAGKTTIHKFIEGMFFGFFKPYTKRRTYLEDYDKYLPMNSTEYCGILKYEYENKLYRIERNFLKDNSDVKIFDEETGEDITYLFEYDNVTRLHQPASRHLGLNSVVFNNTISTKQLCSKTEDSLAKEVKDNLINLGGTLDEEISIKSVIEKLQNKIDDIGKIGRKKSQYGKIAEEICKLEKEKSMVLSTLNDIREIEIQINNIKKDIWKLDNERKSIENNIKDISYYEVYKKYTNIKKLGQKITKLNIAKEQLGVYSNINEDDYADTIKLESTSKNVKENINELKSKYEVMKSKIEKLDKEIEDLRKFEELSENDINKVFELWNSMEKKKERLEYIYSKLKNISDMDIDDKYFCIKDDIYTYEEKEEEKNKLIYSIDDSKILFYDTDLDKKTKSLKQSTLFSWIFIFSTIILFITALNTNYKIIIISIITALISIYNLYNNKKLKKDVSELKDQIDNSKKEISLKNSSIDKINDDLNSILEKYNCNSKVDLKKLQDKLIAKEHLGLDTAELKNEKQSILIDIDKYESQIHELLFGFKMNTNITQEYMVDLKNDYNKYLDLKRHENMLKEQLEELSDEIEKMEERYRNTQIQIKKKLDQNGFNNLEEFRLGLKKRDEYNKIVYEIENNETLLNNELGNMSINEVDKKLIEMENMSFKNVEKNDKEELKISFENINSEISNKREKLARLEENIKMLYDNIRNIDNVEEDISSKIKIKEKYDKELKALNLAKETIEKISKNIQRDFSPKLNSLVGEVISNITNGKYSEVKITENLDIKIIDSREKFININSLSNGTIDQIYFATRLGINDIINRERHLPIILDDCFIQYDNKRLENILEVLNRESKNRQIIVFTCHTREREILNKMKYNYTNIDI